MQLIIYRALAGIVIAMVLLWIAPSTGGFQQQLMLLVGVIFLLLLLLQGALTRSAVSQSSQHALQYASDATLVSIVVLASGGIFSPFSLIYGLIIIAAGMHARRMLPIVTSVLCCSGYLLAVYGEAWLMRRAGMSEQQALHVLLQISALILAGGVMALIAKRHAALRERSDRAVRQHRKLKDLHDQIMAEMREGVIVLDRSLGVSDMNSAACTLMGERSIASLLQMPEVEAFFKQSDITAMQCETGGLAADGESKASTPLLLAIRHLSKDEDAAWLLTLIDISEVRRLEQQLLQQEKMALLGEMAAMLAHEIRNPIQTIAQGLEIMELRPDTLSEMKSILHQETGRLNRLVGVMLDYATPLVPNPVPNCMSELIRQAVAQVDIEQRGVVRWQCDIDDLLLDGDHFRLVLDNLLSNAVAHDCGSEPVGLTLTADQQRWMLDVSNCGQLDAALRDRLFEPFVTGRSNGIGLGLATVKQVCMVNGWQVRVETDANRVCFTVHGPLRPERVVRARMGAEVTGDSNG